MTKKELIRLADAIRHHNTRAIVTDGILDAFTESHIQTLADFCQSHNPGFKRNRWLGYIAGECGPNGGQR